MGGESECSHAECPWLAPLCETIINHGSALAFRGCSLRARAKPMFPCLSQQQTGFVLPTLASNKFAQLSLRLHTSTASLANQVPPSLTDYIHPSLWSALRS